MVVNRIDFLHFDDGAPFKPIEADAFDSGVVFALIAASESFMESHGPSEVVTVGAVVTFLSEAAQIPLISPSRAMVPPVE